MSGNITRYYSTGQFFEKELPALDRYRPNFSSIDCSARNYQRNDILHYKDATKLTDCKHDKS